MSDLTAAQRASLERLAAQATPGPWRTHNTAYVEAGDNDIVAQAMFRLDPEGRQMNAAFIAAANPASVLSLLTSLRAAEERASAAEAERDALRKVVEDQRRELLARHDAMTEAESRAARDREALRRSLELIDDLLPYALQHWDWKYGDDWKVERDACAAALAATTKETP